MTEKYLKDDKFVCGICRKICNISEAKKYIYYIEWGGFTDTLHWKECCKKHHHLIKEDGRLKDRVYA